MRILNFLFVATICIMPTLVAANCDYNKQIKALALNMYHEARGDGFNAMRLVGEVTINRTKSDDFPNNICDVVYQKHQFSWTSSKKNRNSKPSEEEVWKQALLIAEKLIKEDPVYYTDEDILYFLNPKTDKGHHSWAVNEFVREGHHIFYYGPNYTPTVEVENFSAKNRKNVFLKGLNDTL